MKENYKSKKENFSVVSRPSFALFRAPSRREGGFTIVEMMVVILIIALALFFIFVSFDISKNKTRDAVIVSELEQLQGIAETVYHPEVGYKVLWEKRKGTDPARSDDDDIAMIRERINEVGRTFNLRFPQDSNHPGISGYYEYCAYVFLFSDEDTIFCVDSHGVADKIDVSGGVKVNCQILDHTIHNCDFY
jgi:prepilin-type N-terminal cleavage/methylation domain-containing protein